MKDSKKVPISKDTNICEIGLSIRSYNALSQVGMVSIGDIVSKKESQIKQIKNIGKASFSDIKNVVHECGFLFKGEEPQYEIKKLKLRTGAYNALVYSGITKIKQLIKYEESELLELPGIGTVAIKDIKEKIGAVGLCLRKGENDNSEFSDEKICELSLSKRAQNALQYNHITEFKQLAILTQEELLGMPHVGTAILKEISEKLCEVGVTQTECVCEGLKVNEIPHVEMFKLRGIERLEQFTEYTKEELLDMSGVGKITIAKIEVKLHEKGLNFKKQSDDISKLHLKCERTLRKAGISTVRQLKLYPKQKLSYINGIGEFYSDEIYQTLKENGIELLDTDNIPGDISQLGINCTTALRRAKIDTMDELIKHTEEDLLLVRGFGQKSLEEVQKALEKRGLELKKF